MCAVYPDARNPFAHPELALQGWDAWTVPEVWLMAHAQANTWVDVTASIDRKVAALLAHESQITDVAGLEERMRGWGAATAKAGGLAEGRLAEAFLRIDTA